jgi:hypothetical protein
MWKPQVKKPACSTSSCGHVQRDRATRGAASLAVGPACRRTGRPRAAQRASGSAASAVAMATAPYIHTIQPKATDHGLVQRREDELAERSPGVDHAGREPRFAGIVLARRRRSGSRSCRRRRRLRSSRRGTIAARFAGDLVVSAQPAPAAPASTMHAARAPAVGHGAEHRLHGTPDELPDGQREAEAHDAQPGVRVDRGQEQAPSIGARPW